jgi:hypothetical protein
MSTSLILSCRVKLRDLTRKVKNVGVLPAQLNPMSFPKSALTRQVIKLRWSGEMRFRPTIGEYSMLLLLVSCVISTEQLFAQGTQRSTRAGSSSETNSLEIFKDLNRLDVKENGTKQLEDELSKSLQPFANRQDMDVPSGYVVPRQPIIKTRRSKDDLEKSKGWVWNAEEAVSGSLKDDGDSFSGFNSRKRKFSWDDYAEQTRSDRKLSSIRASETRHRTIRTPMMIPRSPPVFGK